MTYTDYFDQANDEYQSGNYKEALRLINLSNVKNVIKSKFYKKNICDLKHLSQFSNVIL